MNAPKPKHKHVPPTVPEYTAADERASLESFARDICACSMARRMGVTFATARKHMSDATPIGDFWITVAEAIEEGLARQMDKAFPETPEPKGIQ